MKWLWAAITALIFVNTSPPAPLLNSVEGSRPKSVLFDVPFTSQAPYGEWSDPRHQDGCEETAIVMAMAWAGKASMTSKAGNTRMIEEIWKWEEKNYGNARDTNAQDTAERIIGRYFNYDNFRVETILGYWDIMRELAKGNVVIVPADGRGLNPNYTVPGPERHMILVRGYDEETGEFITNDAGTRKGEKYRYKYEVLFNAIRDYPTGDHVPIVGREKKMIIVGLLGNT